MKNKTNKSIKSPSNILNKNFSLNQKDISIREEKKGFLNKSNLNCFGKKQKPRKANSLRELSKKFMKCIFESGSNIINLNAVIKKINVKKRRIYDITNVLEGK